MEAEVDEVPEAGAYRDEALIGCVYTTEVRLNINRYWQSTEEGPGQLYIRFVNRTQRRSMPVESKTAGSNSYLLYTRIATQKIRRPMTSSQATTAPEKIARSRLRGTHHRRHGHRIRARANDHRTLLACA